MAAASLLHYVAQFRQRVLFPIIGVMLMAFLLAAGLFFQVAGDIDRRAAAQSQRAVDSVMQQRTEALGRLLLDYAAWGEAYANLHGHVSQEWAFDQQNLGPTLYSSFGIGDVFVIGPGGQRTYAVVEGLLTAAALPAERLGSGIADVVKRARQSAPNTSTAVLDTLVVDGAPVLVAAAALSTGFDPSVAAIPGPLSILVFGDRLTEAKLEAIAAAAFVSDLYVARDVGDAASLPHLALGTGNRVVATLRWTPERPGSEMIGAVLPWFVVAASAFVALLILIVRHGMHAAEGLQQTAAELAEAHRRAEHQARHDALTGLPNRSMLSAVLKAALKEQQYDLAVLYLDLDRFKPVNDAHGHEAGDHVLREVAGRLKQTMREGDLVARVGGDEFVIVLLRPSGRTIDNICCRLLDAVSVPIGYNGAHLSVGASIGVATPADGALAETLIRNADVALFRAKAAGRNCYRRFSDPIAGWAATPSVNKATGGLPVMAA